jgi:hypothetical protein
VKIVDPAIDEYMMGLTPVRHPVLAEMEAFAAVHQFPIIGDGLGLRLLGLVDGAGAGLGWKD